MKFLPMLAKVLALTVILFVCFAFGSTVAMRGVTQSPQSGGSAAFTLVLVCFLQTMGVSYLILRSRWSGWRLIAAIFVVYYGVTTFMPQIESAVFLTRLPAGMLPRLFLMGLLIAIPFSILAVVILGKRESAGQPTADHFHLKLPVSEWSWKLALIAVVYVVLYFTFGYFIAWRSPAVREFYGGADSGNFFGQMQTVLRDTPWLIPFQIFRAICWAGIAVVVIRLLEAGKSETALVLGYMFAVVMCAPLLLPNPYMPEPVRMTHLTETASSNFIFGVFVGWML
ncbi:MAG: hypothetical protein ACJ8AK_06825 [Gemmatimonadaceae bacterium]